jgi:hypothetical protein
MDIQSAARARKRTSIMQQRSIGSSCHLSVHHTAFEPALTFMVIHSTLCRGVACRGVELSGDPRREGATEIALETGIESIVRYLPMVMHPPTRGYAR